MKRNKFNKQSIKKPSAKVGKKSKPNTLLMNVFKGFAQVFGGTQ